jgi:predicted nucleotidyltransferase
MVQIHDIQRFADGIVHHFHPAQIVLFGSYAWGTPGPDSDVDLLVILPFEGKTWKMAGQIRKAIRSPFPLDLIVRTPEEIRRRLSSNDSFIREITQKGRILYEG